MQRQNEGHLPPFPIWDDVRTFDGRPWRGVVDVVSGGFPCQDISAAGTGDGLDGERSGLWVEMARIIGEVRPRFAFVENSPMLTSRGLGTVLGDLAEMGYDAEWGVLGAADVGAPHQRDRIWIVAHTAGDDCNTRRAEPKGQQRQAWPADGGNDVADASCGRCHRTQGGEVELTRRAETVGTGGNLADPDRQRLEEQHPAAEPDQARQHPWGVAAIGREGWWATEPGVGRVAHGLANRVDRLQALGNGQVPVAAAEAFRRLLARIDL